MAFRNPRACMFCLLLAGATGVAAAQTAGPWQVSGDFRSAFEAEKRDARDGSENESSTWGTRFRLRLRRDFGDHWRFQTRLASTFEDEGNDAEFFIRSQRQSSTNIAPGSTTLDEAFLRWQSADKATRVQVGRFQSSLGLPLVTDKSLDRNQATSNNIGWTDGLQLTRDLGRGWEGLLVAQYNGHDGNGTPTRGPIEFSDSGSRISSFAALVNEQPWGPIIQRALAVTWYPDALATDGVTAPRREDYVTATFKLAAGWDVGKRTRLIVGGELGQALNTPTNTAMRLPGGGDSDGFGWLLGADLVDIFPDHRVGIVYGEADAGWLVSNDIRQNDKLAELRWSWQVSEPLRIQFRARWRYEKVQRVGAPFKQKDRDMRLRFTWSF